MSKLKIEEHNNTFLLTVPYALNPAFREIFKTAEWNSAKKAFTVKNTAQNRNKWEKFLEMAEFAANALAKADEAEASSEELRCAYEGIQKLLIELAKRENDAKRQITELRPLHAEAQRKLAELEKETMILEDERDKLIAPVLTLYKNHDIDEIINLYRRGASKGYSGKSICQDAAKKLWELRKDLRNIGFQISAMDELLNTSTNRIDQIGKRVDTLSRNKISGIKPYIQEEQKEE